jgi:hypothetical protein
MAVVAPRVLLKIWQDPTDVDGDLFLCNLMDVLITKNYGRVIDYLD